MYELEKNGKVFTSKSVGTGPSSCEKRIYRAAVSQRLNNTVLDGIFSWKFHSQLFTISLLSFPNEDFRPIKVHPVELFCSCLILAVGTKNFGNGPKWWALKQPELLPLFCRSYRAPALIISPPPPVSHYHGSTVVKVLCYKSECHWFDSRWCY